MNNASAGIVAAGVLLVSAAAFAAPPSNPGQQTVPGAPPVTGTMHDGNNTQPPKLTLQGPMAPITEALESTAPSASSQKGGATSQGQNAGGLSGSARAGGGN